jgi:hypothetical protein
MNRMKGGLAMSKKVVSIGAKSKILKSRSQSEIVAEHKRKRKVRLDPLLEKWN